MIPGCFEEPFRQDLRWRRCVYAQHVAALSLRSHLSEQVAAMNHYTAKEKTSLPSASRDIANAYAISSYSAIASAMQSRPQETKTIMVKACQTEANAQLRGQTSYCMRRTDALGSRCCQRGSGAAGNATKFLTWRSKASHPWRWLNKHTPAKCIA